MAAAANADPPINPTHKGSAGNAGCSRKRTAMPNPNQKTAWRMSNMDVIFKMSEGFMEFFPAGVRLVQPT